MLDLILALIPSEWLAAIGVAVTALAAIWLGGRKSAQADIKAKAATEEAEDMRRVADADLGIGASDGDRIDRLREFSKRHGG